MSRLKKYFFHDKKSKKIVLGIFILLIGLILGITFSANVTEEVKSIEITSNDWDDMNPTPGSWKITKSTDWVDANVAEIKFDVMSNIKLADEAKDIILVLDTSGTMSALKYSEERSEYVSKLEKMKEDVTSLTKTVLSKSDNRMALIEFNTHATILSEFSNDENTILEKVEGLKADGATNYRDALEKVGDILTNANYEIEKSRDLVVLFLSDGVPIYETPNQVGEYQALKEKYPEIIIHSIQYELGNTPTKELIDISDRQYVADIASLENTLLESSTAVKFYEEFEVTDFIDTDNFYVSPSEDIEVTNGTVDFDEANQKIIWHLGGYNKEEYSGNYLSGLEATMSIKASLKEEYHNIVGLYTSNKKESVVSRLYNEQSQTVNSTSTPKIYNGYSVYYDTNPPAGCAIKKIESKVHSILDIIKISDEIPVCEGFQFKGWKIIEEDDNYLSTEQYSKDQVYKINDDSFRMPRKDVHLTATWTKLDIKKSMLGKIYEVKRVSLKDRILASGIDTSLGRIAKDNEKSTYVSASTGIDFAKASGEENGKGLYIRSGSENDENPIYYYRGAVTNNNVIFAGFCWKIVRTTETGGIKLVYNGTPTDGQCITNENSFGISYAYYNRDGLLPVAVGYMHGKDYGGGHRNYLNMTNTSDDILNIEYIDTDKLYYFTKETPTWDGKKYILSDVIDSNGINSFIDIWENAKSKLNSGTGYYTCYQSTAGGNCSTVYYVIRTRDSSSSHYSYSIELSGGQSLSDEDTISLGTGVKSNGDNTYSLTGVKNIKKTEWYDNYKNYKNYYICSDFTSTTCQAMKLYYIITPDYEDFKYSIAGEIVFGNDVEYKNGIYTLKDTKVKSVSESWNKNNYLKKHYTCFSTSNSCSEVYYVYHAESRNMVSYITLNGEENIDAVLEEMFSNQYDSDIKEGIDNWYMENIEEKNYSNSLENAVWCNDRTISIYNSWNKDINLGENTMYFGAYGNRGLSADSPNPGLKDNLACPNVRDRFTVNDSTTGKGNGNGALKYKIGMLTADELTAAGNGTKGYSKDTYLIDNFSGVTDEYGMIRDYISWTMTPHRYNADYSILADNFMYSIINYVDTSLIPIPPDGTQINDVSGSLSSSDMNNVGQLVRPSISLKSDIQVLEIGDGSSTNPYVVR